MYSSSSHYLSSWHSKRMITKVYHKDAWSQLNPYLGANFLCLVIEQVFFYCPDFLGPEIKNMEQIWNTILRAVHEKCGEKFLVPSFVYYAFHSGSVLFMPPPSHRSNLQVTWLRWTHNEGRDQEQRRHHHQNHMVRFFPHCTQLNFATFAVCSVP